MRAAWLAAALAVLALVGGAAADEHNHRVRSRLRAPIGRRGAAPRDARAVWHTIKGAAGGGRP